MINDKDQILQELSFFSVPPLKSFNEVHILINVKNGSILPYTCNSLCLNVTSLVFGMVCVCATFYYTKISFKKSINFITVIRQVIKVIFLGFICAPLL